MAATQNAYRNKSLFIRNKENNGDIQILTAIPQIDKQTMLSRFFLDGILNINLENGIDGVIGYCIIGGANHLMHNTIRESSIQLYNNNRNCILYLDAGLNTKGKPTTIFIINKKINNLQIAVTYLSSFYGTTSYGLYVSKNNGSFIKYTNGSIADGNTLIYNSFPTLTHNVGDYIRIKPFAENGEGEIVDNNILSFYVRPDKYYFKWVLVNETGYRTITVSLIDANQTPIIAEFEITTYNRLEYKEGNSNYNYDFEISIQPNQFSASLTLFDSDFGYDEGEPNIVQSVGYLSHAPLIYDGIPIEQYAVMPASIRYDYTGYSLNSYDNACTINNSKSIYRSGYVDNNGIPTYYNNNYYATPFITDLCDNGFYSVGGRWYLMINGLLEDEDSC